MDMKVIQEEIYYCSCCGQFFELGTSRLLQVHLEKLPVSFAEKVKEDRKNSTKACADKVSSS